MSSQNMWIGTANRLAKVGETVAVTFNGKTVNAKVASSFASTRVLIIKAGDIYYAYPGKIQTRRFSHREQIKHDKKKKRKKPPVQAIYTYFVSTQPESDNPTGSIYVFDGQQSRLLAENIRLQINNNYLNSFYVNSRVTNYGYGKYRCSLITGLTLIRNNSSDGRNYIPNKLQIFTSETEEVETHNLIVRDANVYPPEIFTTSPEPDPSDWQDPYYQTWWVDNDQIDACIAERFITPEGIQRGERLFRASNLYGFPNLEPETGTITYLSFADKLNLPYDESANYPVIGLESSSAVPTGEEFKELLLTVGTYGPPHSYERSNYIFGDVCPVIAVKEDIPFELELLDVGFDYTYLLLLDMSLFYDGPL